MVEAAPTRFRVRCSEQFIADGGLDGGMRQRLAGGQVCVTDDFIVDIGDPMSSEAPGRLEMFALQFRDAERRATPLLEQREHCVDIVIVRFANHLR
jgi:hypothetical protein